ncbi:MULTISPECIES: molybdate ABC transporter substrate-binding protein [Methylosinus]|uniref:Molybdate ABC transporter substrate-binding protein n=1 Tax=Methylosinus trichosporium (strain ATCC 35070 / NCIMB 11131 / UNIQEM 75 / OB3b) TaxID=595536 RepID=A0A2D2D6K2_METT3|nr:MULTISPECIES: molybdate ABC transporter substrate-binding protein [Methylosinus]ATQ70647.1 molybdate ABC transporter substrate-binding protein [Methylosinus trichosporium OB3b]OBS50735.1 molybdate ABC transporter substrate-binding protein [Methylosinus sp. 3S-1]
MKGLLVVSLLLTLLGAPARAAGSIAIAAAADLKFAMDEIVADFRSAHPGDDVSVIYGSSGKFHTQIQNGAPFDIFFSADIAYARSLLQNGSAASEPVLYAVGRIVLWSGALDAARMTLENLVDPHIRRIAIANPKHAPYGRAAEEALKAEDVWNRLQGRLVFGENVAQTAQYARTGAADVAIIALSLVLSPELKGKGSYSEIPENLYAPLRQAFVVTKRGGNNPLAETFAKFMASPAARRVMIRYGFVLPGETAQK